MVNVETISLAQRGVQLPSARVGIVIAQPHVVLSLTEPFHCTPESKVAQLANIAATLAVARDRPHGESKTHFTVFPEYSIPGSEGVALIQSTLADAAWPVGTIVIGGTDALTKPQFVALANEPGSHVHPNPNPVDRIADHEWVNCGITWVKGANGIVERWLQPKLAPAWLELNISYQDMFRGDSVFAFKGLFDNNTEFYFSTLVCFDWIARVGEQKAWHWVLSKMAEQVAPGQISLSWFFVIQRNPRPSHDTFLSEVSGFYDQNSVQNIRRDRTCLVFANNAGAPKPGRALQFGGTSLIFAPQAPFAKAACHTTFSNGGQRYRSSTLLQPFSDVFFREAGACIHSFAQTNPAALNIGAGGRDLPILRPDVFPLPGSNDSGRAPRAPVAGSIKWLHDELDAQDSGDGLRTRYPEAPLAQQAGVAHHQSVSGLRALPAQSADHVVKLTSCEAKKRQPDGKMESKNADEWGTHEADGVEHLLHTLGILGIAYTPANFDALPAQATVAIKGRTIDVLAIRGVSHEACIEHSKTFPPLPRRQVLLVSRDLDNNPWRVRFGSFLETQTAQLGEERKITDPRGGMLHLGYRKLLDEFRGAPTPAELRTRLDAELAA